MSRSSVAKSQMKDDDIQDEYDDGFQDDIKDDYETNIHLLLTLKLAYCKTKI